MFYLQPWYCVISYYLDIKINSVDILPNSDFLWIPSAESCSHDFYDNVPNDGTVPSSHDQLSLGRHDITSLSYLQCYDTLTCTEGGN